MNYYRKSNKDNKEEIKNLNNKIDIVYNLFENNIEERNDLLILFNSRINNNIPDKNILNKNIKVIDNKYNIIFTCKSIIGDIYKYVFHISIKSDHSELNLKFIINNKNSNYEIFINKYKYIRIEEKFIFNNIENFKIYLESDKPLTIMKYTSYEILINYHEATILNNQEHIKRLIYKTNKWYESLADNNKLIKEYTLKDIEKDDLPI